MRIRYSRQKDGKPVRKAFVYTREEHGIAIADVDKDAVYIVERLKASGNESYIVGGAVRDLILGKKPKDFDIVTSASPSRIKKLFRNSRIIGRRFRLVHVYFDQKIFEVSTFRSIKDGHTGNTFGSIEEDVLRRDFSLNALFYDPGEEVVVDYVGGMRDIRNKKIRPIIPLPIIFKDDPVRMIRAVKYAASTGFKIPLSLGWKIKQQAPLLAEVSPSRLTEEINKIINSPCAPAIIQQLMELGLFVYLQPQAFQLMQKDKGYRKMYLEGFCAAGKQPSAPAGQKGEKLACLIREYLNRTIAWDMPPAEIYKEAFQGARNFVLPMNPPRIELDDAVRLVFREHEIVLKRNRIFERPRTGKRSSDKTPPPADGSGGGEEGRKRKRRRRARRNPQEGALNTGKEGQEIPAGPDHP
ncbi:polynucleotide adenylyltransferase PcnB [Treponema sp. OttesenSCG-928-L16]|nr:polynucleotide adenylyltransferase PcnB [Treponema sp. OttesenSCG-928-L16]